MDMANYPENILHDPDNFKDRNVPIQGTSSTSHLTMGFIGFGKSTQRYHLPYLKMRPHIHVKTIYNRRLKPEMENHPHINFTTDLDELLQDPQIQLISITTTGPSHYDFAKKSLEAGKHVLVEKPFMETVAQTKELLELANSKNLMLMPFQNRRFDADFLATKKVLETGFLGDLIEIETHYDYFRPSTASNFGTPVDGFVYGHAVHLLDRMISLFGRPHKVFYDVRNVRTGVGLDDYHDIHLFYDRFKVICKSQHLVKIPYPQFRVQGSKGTFIKFGIDTQEYDLKAGIMPWDEGFGEDNTYNYGKLEYLNQNGDTIKRELKTPQGDYGKVYDHVADTILNGAPKLISDEEILTVMEIMERAYEAPSPHIIDL